MSKILVAEDEPAIRRLLAAILTRAGHEPVFAETGREALAVVGRGGVDAVLLDLGLPDRDGLEILSAIRGRHGLPILVVTAPRATRPRRSRRSTWAPTIM